MNDIWQILIGSGLGVTLIGYLGKKAVEPYARDFKRIAKEVIPNGGSSISDRIKVIDTRTKETADSLEVLKCDHRAFMYIIDRPFFKSDLQGRCVFVNKAYMDMVNMPADDCLGDGWQRALHPDDVDRVVLKWIQTVKSKTNFQDSYRFIQQVTGMIYHVNCKANHIFDADHKHLGSVGILEITQVTNPHTDKTYTP